VKAAGNVLALENYVVAWFVCKVAVWTAIFEWIEVFWNRERFANRN
jgi:hypothetical protein